MKTGYFVIVVALGVISILGFAMDSHSQFLSSNLDALINDYVANQQSMGTVLVAEKGEVVFAKGYGLADVEKSIPNTPETKFMIGSITKQFTAMLVTQLVEKGRLRLDNTISDLIPEFPKCVIRRHGLNV